MSQASFANGTNNIWEDIPGAVVSLTPGKWTVTGTATIVHDLSSAFAEQIVRILIGTTPSDDFASFAIDRLSRTVVAIQSRQVVTDNVTCKLQTTRTIGGSSDIYVENDSTRITAIYEGPP
jgi:hypothetical protein